MPRERENPLLQAVACMVLVQQQIFYDLAMLHEEQAVNTAPCPLCGAPKGTPCKSGEFEAAVPHIARLVAAWPPARGTETARFPGLFSVTPMDLGELPAEDQGGRP